MLIMPGLLWREMEERTRRALPGEACGLLLGFRRGNEIEIAALASARNLAVDPTQSFELDPLDAMAAEDAARGVGLAVVGVWHSHPRGPLDPSAADLAGRGEAWLTLIVVPQPKSGIQLSCWRNTSAGFEPVDVAQTLSTRG